MNRPLDWEGCKQARIAKPVVANHEQIASIIETARKKEQTTLLLPVNETTKETIITLWYDVLRELLEALALSAGYKIYNHECYTPFLRTVIKDENFAHAFDSLRLLRNRIQYYGKDVLLMDAEATVINARELIKTTRTLLRK
ncbi:MAG: hypothetical protein Q7K43_06855 [Candidatus Woesearchaeota archaeon]|nr:hypothetical protein [Candidatus Woesearchaeota archaeon]